MKLQSLRRSLADLVLPSVCAGCRDTREDLTIEVCPSCIKAVGAMTPFGASPTPAPPGLPPCFALGEYGGELRELILEFKERGRHRLARPLGALLAEVVAAAVVVPQPVLLLYVPDTGAAARERLGDHMRALAHAACARLRVAGWEVSVHRAFTAKPKRADSAGLDAVARAEAAREAFAADRLRLALARRAATARQTSPAGRLSATLSNGVATRRKVVLMDDILTTGATLAAASELLAEADLEVDVCAVLAATKRRLPA